jgi:hypothetical protein
VLGVGVLAARVVGAEVPAGEPGVPDEQAARASMAVQREPDSANEIREVIMSPKTPQYSIRLSLFTTILQTPGRGCSLPKDL